MMPLEESLEDFLFASAIQSVLRLLKEMIAVFIYYYPTLFQQVPILLQSGSGSDQRPQARYGTVRSKHINLRVTIFAVPIGK